MLRLVLSVAMLMTLCVYAEEPPTYESGPIDREFATGYVPQPLTAEEQKLKSEFDTQAKKEGWTFDYDVTQVGKHKTGYKPGDGKHVSSFTEWFRHGAQKIKPVSWRAHHRMLDQGPCGSCVVFAIGGNFQLSHTLRNMFLPPLSMQHLMNCGGEAGQCSGDWGERVAARLKKLGGLTSEDVYPYTARTSSCKYKEEMPLYGQIEEWMTIEDSFESLATHVYNREPVSVGVAADSRFSAYRSGVYNGFGSMSTNHYVLMLGYTCGSSVDAEGYCLFDEQGNLKNGNHEGTVIIANSWGDWGDDGFIEMQFENKSGKRNNNIAGGSENAQVLLTGIPVPPVGPVVFTLKGPLSTIKFTVQPGKYNPERIKAAFAKVGFVEVK